MCEENSDPEAHSCEKPQKDLSPVNFNAIPRIASGGVDCSGSTSRLCSTTSETNQREKNAN